MYTRKFDTGCRQPDLPGGNAGTVHGQAVDMFQAGLRDRVSSLTDQEDMGEAIEGDDDFVVFFGDLRYVLAVP